MDEELIIPKKIINRINLILGMFIALIPIFVSLIGCFGITILSDMLLVIFVIAFVFFLLFSSLNLINNKDFTQKLITFIKKPITIILLTMITWMILSSLINGEYNIYLVFYIAFFFVFYCFYYMDKKSLNIVLNTLLIVLAISCLLGLLNPTNEIVPGFIAEAYPFATHFRNPNHSAYATALLTIVVFNYFNKSNKTYKYIYYGLLYVIFSYFLFLNGTYSAIFAVFVVEIFQIMFLWIKFKKCPYKMLSLLMLLIPLCLLSDIYPNIQNIRTCRYNFMLESVAVFDNIFKTDLLSIFGIDEIVGSNGWDRDMLLYDTFIYLTSNFKTFVFGSGAGTMYDLKPHNVLMCLWLDFGIIVPICFIIILVLLFIKKCKTTFHLNHFCNISVVILYCIMMQFGNIFACSFVYFVPFLALSFKQEDEIKKSLPNS